MGEFRESQWKIGKKVQKHPQMFDETVQLLCYICLLFFSRCAENQSFSRQRAWTVCARLLNPTWLVPPQAEPSQRRSVSWMNRPHRPDRSETDNMCFHSGSVHLPSFYPHFLSSCCLSILSLAPSWSVLPIPVIRAL